MIEGVAGQIIPIEDEDRTEEVPVVASQPDTGKIESFAQTKEAQLIAAADLVSTALAETLGEDEVGSIEFRKAVAAGLGQSTTETPLVSASLIVKALEADKNADETKIAAGKVAALLTEWGMPDQAALFTEKFNARTQEKASV